MLQIRTHIAPLQGTNASQPFLSRILTGTYRRRLVVVSAACCWSPSPPPPPLAPFTGVHLNKRRLFPRDPPPDPIPVEDAVPPLALALALTAAATTGTHSLRHFLTGPVNVVAGP